jgi:hypothetical protein
MTTDLQTAFDVIKDKRKIFDELYSYYDGHPSLKYSTQRIARAFNNSLAYFAENWAAVIINAVLDRLVLKGFDAGEDTVNNTIDELFTRLNINLDAKDIHESLQIVGEAFLIVDVVDGETEVYWNDPRQCHMEYNPDRPKVKSFGAKEWVGSDGKTYINLYYSDRTEKYVSDKGQTAKSFVLVESVPNDTGVIPVFHFKNSRRIIKGELDSSTVSMLDAINKLFSDLMVAAEFETFKTKVFISQVDPGDIKVGPDMKLWLPANESGGEDTKVIELGGGNLENFLKPINDLATSLAIQTRTPKHYFFQDTSSNLSGEALLTMESPLVKKVMSKQESYDPTWKEFAAYLLFLNGVAVDANDLVTVWEPAESTQPLTEAQILKTNKEAGVPVLTSARRQGWAEDEIQQLEEDLATEAKNRQDTLATSMLSFNRE